MNRRHFIIWSLIWGVALLIGGLRTVFSVDTYSFLWWVGVCMVLYGVYTLLSIILTRKGKTRVKEMGTISFDIKTPNEE